MEMEVLCMPFAFGNRQLYAHHKSGVYCTWIKTHLKMINREFHLYDMWVCVNTPLLFNGFSLSMAECIINVPFSSCFIIMVSPLFSIVLFVVCSKQCDILLEKFFIDLSESMCIVCCGALVSHYCYHHKWIWYETYPHLSIHLTHILEEPTKNRNKFE